MLANPSQLVGFGPLVTGQSTPTALPPQVPWIVGSEFSPLQAGYTCLFPSGKWANPSSNITAIASETNKVAVKVRFLIDPIRAQATSTLGGICYVAASTDSGDNTAKIDVACSKDGSGNIALSVVFGNSGTAQVTGRLNAASIPAAGTWVVMYAHADRTTPSRYAQLSDDFGNILTDGTHTMSFSDSTSPGVFGSGGYFYLNDSDQAGAVNLPMQYNGAAVYVATTLATGSRYTIPNPGDTGIAELVWTGDGSGTTLAAAVGNTLALSSGAFTWPQPGGLWAPSTNVYTLPATVATYAETGNAAPAKYGINASPTTYAETSVAARVGWGRSVPSSVTTYALTGIAAGTWVARKIASTVTPYTVSGIAAGTVAARQIPASPTAYTLSGIAAALKRGRGMAATVTTFAVSGIAAGTTVGRLLSATVTTYSVGGVAIGLLAARQILASTDAYAVTSIPATLTWTPANALHGSGGATLVLGAGPDMGIAQAPPAVPLSGGGGGILSPALARRIDEELARRRRRRQFTGTARATLRLEVEGGAHVRHRGGIARAVLVLAAPPEYGAQQPSADVVLALCYAA